LSTSLASASKSGPVVRRSLDGPHCVSEFPLAVVECGLVLSDTKQRARLDAFKESWRCKDSPVHHGAGPELICDVVAAPPAAYSAWPPNRQDTPWTWPFMVLPRPWPPGHPRAALLARRGPAVCLPPGHPRPASLVRLHHPVTTSCDIMSPPVAEERRRDRRRRSGSHCFALALSAFHCHVDAVWSRTQTSRATTVNEPPESTL
jgi:hypothetical protein